MLWLPLTVYDVPSAATEELRMGNSESANDAACPDNGWHVSAPFSRMQRRKAWQAPLSHSGGWAPHSGGGAPHSGGGAPHSDGGAPHSDGGAPHSDGGALAPRDSSGKRGGFKERNIWGASGAHRGAAAPPIPPLASGGP